MIEFIPVLHLDDYLKLREKGYTHSLIQGLLLRSPERLQEMLKDPGYLFLGDRSAPLQDNSKSPRSRRPTDLEGDIGRWRQLVRFMQLKIES